MNQLQRWWIWMRRMGHCRGFGIQSPNDYWFVRYVVNEHWPYYQYESLGHGHDWLTQKLGRLCLRVANWQQPKTAICDEELQSYIQAGCLRTIIKTEGTKADLTVLTAREGERVMEAIGQMDYEGILIVRDIGHFPELWQQVVSNLRTRISFDLYYCGIILFNQKREKQNYIINF